jgi:anti-sigma B factor antagonist
VVSSSDDAVVVSGCPEPASFRTKTVGGCAVIVASGEIDLYTSPGLHDALLLAATQASDRVVVDLSAVTFIDSTGLGLLVAALTRARSAGRSMCLVGPTGLVIRVLRVTRLDQAFEIHVTLGEATTASNS